MMSRTVRASALSRRCPESAWMERRKRREETGEQPPSMHRWPKLAVYVVVNTIFTRGRSLKAVTAMQVLLPKFAGGDWRKRRPEVETEKGTLCC